MPKSSVPPHWYIEAEASEEELAALNRLSAALQSQGSTAPPPQLLPRLRAQVLRRHKRKLALIYVGMMFTWLLAFWLIGQPKVLLQWQANQEAQSFRVYRIVHNQAQLLAQTSQTAYQDLWALPGMQVYQVEALSSTGQPLHTELIRVSTWRAWPGGLAAALLGLLTAWMSQHIPSKPFLFLQRSSYE